MMRSALLIFSAVLLYGLVHSFLASLWFKERIHAWLGDVASRWYRLAYNLFAVISLLPVLALPAVLPDRRLYVIPSPWLYLSIAGQLLAGVALAAGLLQTGVWSFLGLRQLVEGEEKPSELVVKGLYRYVRHPLYTAGLVLIWLMPVMTVNILSLNVGLSLYLVAGAYFEERKLKREFGEAYKRYQARTPMFIPWLI
jgi:protein-S-isoprenylcysteine O-methyltransferase Ste14